MQFLPSLAFAAAVLLALSGATAPAQPISDAQRGEIERIVRDYLLRNPEVLQEAIEELEKRQATAEAEKHRTALRTMPTRCSTRRAMWWLAIRRATSPSSSSSTTTAVTASGRSRT